MASRFQWVEMTATVRQLQISDLYHFQQSLMMEGDEGELVLEHHLHERDYQVYIKGLASKLLVVSTQGRRLVYLESKPDPESHLLHALGLQTKTLVLEKTNVKLSSRTVSQILFCLNDDPALVHLFLKDLPLFRLYMPFTTYEDDWILKFFQEEH